MNPIAAILGLVSTVVSRIWPDKTMAEQAAFALALQQELDKTNILTGQMQVNAAEAGNNSLFVAGWRPWIGWGLGSVIIFYALFTLVVNFMVSWGLHVVPFPPLDPMVRDIVLGMLGLNIGARTFEKVRGVHTTALNNDN